MLGTPTNSATEGEGAADAREILSSYKEQNFTFLKIPSVVNAIILKMEERIKAIGLNPDIFTAQPGAG